MTGSYTLRQLYISFRGMAMLEFVCWGGGGGTTNPGSDNEVRNSSVDLLMLLFISTCILVTSAGHY